MSKKKILFVMNTLGGAGAENALLELLDRLNRQEEPERPELYLYVLMGQGELVDRLPEGVHLLNKNFHDCSVLSAKGRCYMAGTVIKALCKNAAGIRLFPYLCRNLFQMIKSKRIQADKLLWRVLSEGAQKSTQEYDLAVAFLEGGSAYYVADRVKAKKKAAFIHIAYQEAGYTRQLDKDCYLNYDAVFPIAEEIQDKFLEVYPECREKTTVFHNMINRELIWEKANEEGGFPKEDKGIKLLTVGRLTKQKAYPVAIEAMKRLKEEGFPVKWYVLGEGEERRSLEKKIAACGLRQDFILVGAVKNPYPYYKQADIYVHATGFEGKSIAIQEAQVLGCPIVASDCTGNREQICDGEDGILCPLEPEAVKNAIVELLTDAPKRQRLGEAASHKKVAYEEDLQQLWKLLG